VYRSTENYQAGVGGSETHFIAPGKITEIYVGFWWRTNPEFTGNNANANKTFFIRSSQGGTNGVFYLSTPPGQSKVLFWSTQWNWNMNQCGGHAPDQDQCFPNVATTPIVPGQWYRIEVYMKASSCQDCHDGAIRWWITPKGGTPVLQGNFVNFAYGPLVDEWVWSETWDGAGNGSGFTSDPSHYIDHLHISAPNCGSGGCPAPSYLVITSSVSTARIGTPYTSTLTADGGTKPYSWFLESGNLPSGLSLNKTTGVISGTPTCVGRSDFTIRVADASSPALSATKAYTIISSGTGPACTSTFIADAEPKSAQPQFTAKAAGGKVTFSLPVTGSGQYRLSVYDLAGKKVYEHRSMGQKETGLAKDLKTGVYFARFVQGTRTSAVRFSVMN